MNTNNINNTQLFSDAEELGRDITLNLFPHLNLQESTDPFEVYDFKGFTPSSTYYIEVKYRNVSSTFYPTDLLEYLKMKHLFNVDEDANHYYFVIFSDGVARMYHLNKVPVTSVYFSIVDCPQTTVTLNGNKDKYIVELPIKKAKEYKWN